MATGEGRPGPPAKPWPLMRWKFIHGSSCKRPHSGQGITLTPPGRQVPALLLRVCRRRGRPLPPFRSTLRPRGRRLERTSDRGTRTTAYRAFAAWPPLRSSQPRSDLPGSQRRARFDATYALASGHGFAIRPVVRHSSQVILIQRDGIPLIRLREVLGRLRQEEALSAVVDFEQLALLELSRFCPRARALGVLFHACATEGEFFYG